jgi:ankyrin repeat protein
MKSLGLFVAVLMFVVNAFAADALTEKLQRGLFEEEANHNLDAAIKEYQSVVTQADEQRKVIATALFRLGECYRKLGKTNEANAQYQCILRDFSEQEQLVRLVNEFLKVPATVVASRSELFRELQRRLTEARVQNAAQQMELNRLSRLSRSELLNSDMARNDARLIALRQSELDLEQKSAALKIRLSDSNPEVQAVEVQRKLVAERIEEVLGGIMVSAKSRVQSSADQLMALEAELKNVEATGRESSAAVLPWKTVTDPEQVRLLREEIKLAEQQVTVAEKSYAVGRATLASVLNAKRDVLAVSRLLPENSSLLRQKSLLNEQVKIVEQLLKEANELEKVGRASPTDAIPLRRELLTLQREMAALTEGSTAGTTATPAPTALTQTEAEDLARVKTLARNSPDLLRAPLNGFTELQRAARAGHYSVVEFLLSQDVRPDDAAPGTSPLFEAAARGHLRIVQLLLDKGATKADASEALTSACQAGFKSVAEFLIERGADVNYRTDRNVTPLHFAARGGQTASVDMLLKHGAQPNVLSADQNQRQGFSAWSIRGATPLHFAVDQPNAIMVAQLISAGATANATNFEGRTPLHLAASSGNTNLGALLLDHGADPNAKVANGQTVLGMAIGLKRAEFVSLLLRRGADVNLIGLEYSNIGYESPLMAATRSGTLEVLTTLLAAKPNLEATNQSGNTALGMAVRSRQDDYAEKLLDAGANPNVTDLSGYPLIRYALDGSARIVDALLRHGANPNVVKDGETPLSVVLRMLSAPPSGQKPSDRKAEFERMAASLRQHGADEFLQRRGFISALRGPDHRVDIFSKGTNDLNRYTLMEFLAAVYEKFGEDLPFPDFSKVIIHRIAARTEKLTPDPNAQVSVNAVGYVRSKEMILVDAAKMLANTNDCSGDVPLEWGDYVEIPMADHSVSAMWEGIEGTEFATLKNCLERTVRFSAGNTNLLLALSPPLKNRRLPQALGGSNNRSSFFRLSAVVLRDNRFRNLLRSSSDLSRVTVTRLDLQTKAPKKMTFDVNAVALPDMSYSGSRPPLSWQHDLWLRDGDVIEVPEKQ